MTKSDDAEHESAPTASQEKERVRHQVFKVADSLLWRGIRPTVVQIENEVSAPRHVLIALLESWAAGLAVCPGNAPSDTAYELPGRRGNRSAGRQHAVSMVRNAYDAYRVATKTKVTELNAGVVRDLRREIERAKETLARLESTMPRRNRRNVQIETLNKVRRRLVAMEEEIDKRRGSI